MDTQRNFSGGSQPPFGSACSETMKQLDAAIEWGSAEEPEAGATDEATEIPAEPDEEVPRRILSGQISWTDFCIKAFSLVTLFPLTSQPFMSLTRRNLPAFAQNSCSLRRRVCRSLSRNMLRERDMDRGKEIHFWRDLFAHEERSI